jgi:GR25 family glycosyltransferase involved in LPS biosynthesis
MRLIQFFSPFSLILLMSCGQTNDDTLVQVKLNDLQMNINGITWKPSVIDNCNQTYMCRMSELTGGTIYQGRFYSIHAYRDPHLVADLMSENFFEMKIMEANEVGMYVLDGVFKDFSNYARLTINDENGKRVYQNMENDTSFKVEITRLHPNPNSSVVGIEGQFSGILHNQTNSNDSIVVSNGQFLFKKTNTNGFNQCKE